MKNFVLDTNVLLHDPNAIFKFKDNQVVIPIYVIEEIDMFKKEQSEVGRNARMIGRLLDEVREAGNLANGVPLKTGGTLRVGFTERTLPPQVMNNHTQDNRILALALDIKEKFPDSPTILVTKDINLRIRADVIGLFVEDYDPGEVDIDELYSGYTEVTLDPSQMSAFYQSGTITIDTTELYPNQYALLRDANGGQATALGRVNKTMGRVEQIRKFKQDGVWGIRPRNKEQHFALDLLLDDSVKLVTLVGKAGTGKAQPLDARILTPDGWREMGQIKPGDQVMTPDGTPANVVAVFPQGEKDIYKVTFSDGSSTECCKEHLWYTETTLNRDYHKPGSVKSLEEIMTTLRYGVQQKRNHSIPMTKPVKLSEKELPLDPYLLGCLIGDGSMSTRHPSLATADQEIVNECQSALAALGCRLEKKSAYDYSICCDQPAGAPPLGFLRRDPQTAETKLYHSMREVRSDGFSSQGVYRASTISKAHQGYEWQTIKSDKLSVNPVKDTLRKLGLWGHRAEGKFIPEIYLLGSVEQRIALLQGLMDTDGTIEKQGHKIFFTTSAQLAKDFTALVQSLGGTVTIKTRNPQYTYKGEKRSGQVSYNCNLCLPNEIVPFRLSRKLERWAPNKKYFPRRYIESVELVGEKQAKCILIDHPQHLYITDNFIVTHNTMLAICAGLHKTLEEKVFQRMLVARPVFPMGKDLGYLPGTLEEKLNPWMQPIFDNVEFLLGLQKGDRQNSNNHRGYHELVDLGVLQIEPLTYIRGRSIPHQWMIVDEAQNLTPHEVKTIVTRAGEGTKIIFTGDPYQIDHPYIDAANNGLTYLVNKFKEHKLGGHLTLIKGERSELAELAANIL